MRFYAFGEARFMLPCASMLVARINLLLLTVLVLTGCGGSPVQPGDFDFGRADVYVRDTSGEPINGVQVRLERLNGQVEEQGGLTGTAGPPGYYFFLKTRNDYRIVITPPAGYELAPGQSASVPVSFRKDQTTTTNFVLRRL